MPVTETHRLLARELMELEAALRHLRLWHAVAPSDAALASAEPFAWDTLLFTEWLQFLFIPRLRRLAQAGEPLPTHCAVAPMATESFRANRQPADTVLVVLERIDGLISGDHSSS